MTHFTLCPNKTTCRKLGELPSGNHNAPTSFIALFPTRASRLFPISATLTEIGSQTTSRVREDQTVRFSIKPGSDSNSGPNLTSLKKASLPSQSPSPPCAFKTPLCPLITAFLLLFLWHLITGRLLWAGGFCQEGGWVLRGRVLFWFHVKGRWGWREVAMGVGSGGLWEASKEIYH